MNMGLAAGQEGSRWEERVGKTRREHRGSGPGTAEDAAAA
jgi:hypothetical protein